ncbi:hypothetical protein QQP08_014080 [Theobroma cacao]|nr:hypothetical protein QQP08_014080 [Theobroma cacao]
MSCHDVLLVVHGLPNNEQRVLDDRIGVAKYEIDSARYDAIPVELPMGLNVEGVLTARSDMTRRATAWCPSGPAVFWNPIAFAMNPSPIAAATQIMQNVICGRNSISGGVTITVAFSSGNHGFPRSIPVHENINFILVDCNILIVNPSLHIDNVSSLQVLWICFKGITNGFVLATSILSHYGIRRQLSIVSAGQQLPVLGGNPRRVCCIMIRIRFIHQLSIVSTTQVQVQ